MKITSLIGTLLIVITAITANLCTAQESKPSAAGTKTTTDEGSKTTAAADTPTDPNLVAIRSGAEAFVDAFNKADAAAVANLWTVDGEYVDAAGETFTGRTAIEKSYEEFFNANPGAKLRIHIDSFKLLSDTAAIEEGRTLVEVPPAIAAVGRYTAIHVKADGQWRMASVRDALVDATLAQQNLADFDWLIGTWVAEEHGNNLSSVCHRVGERGFLQRDFTTTLFDGTQSSGVQLIGWNPQRGHVQSWTFNADGGHAVGVWMPSADGWVAQMQGMTGDGISTTSINRLRRLDDNAYMWQSVDRTVDGVAIPDTGEVVIRRQPVTK